MTSPASHPDRRALLALAGGAAALGALAPPPRPLTLINAPSNLGLRPLSPGHVPGAWQAPRALAEAGLDAALRPARTVWLARPAYRVEPQPGSRIRNGHAIRRFSEDLAAAVGDALAASALPVVIGGDCSILLGCLLGARAAGPFGLIHLDGHSDFFHPGNYDAEARPGSAAGMDLALATGRGEPLLAQWDGAPLVEDRHVVQIGERDELDPDFSYADIADTAIRRIPVRRVLARGVEAAAAEALAPVDGERRRLWLHIDLDVLDGAVMPAVDSPGSPGLDWERLVGLVRLFAASGRLLGLDVAIYDPDLDPQRRHARRIVAALARALGPLLQGERR